MFCSFFNRQLFRRFKKEDAEKDQEQAKKLFRISDFIKDLCITMAVKIREGVGGVEFGEFFKVRIYFLTAKKSQSLRVDMHTYKRTG